MGTTTLLTHQDILVPSTVWQANGILAPRARRALIYADELW